MADYYRLSRFAGGPIWNCPGRYRPLLRLCTSQFAHFIATYCVGYPDKCTTEYRLERYRFVSDAIDRHAGKTAVSVACASFRFGPPFTTPPAPRARRSPSRPEPVSRARPRGQHGFHFRLWWRTRRCVWWHRLTSGKKRQYCEGLDRQY